MIQLKEIIDKEINPNLMSPQANTFNVDSSSIKNIRLQAENDKLSNIPVCIENIDGRLLAKVGPCDSSGVGGHLVRAEIIKNLVDQALKAQGLYDEEHRFENINVSACVGVRGRAQMFSGLFFNNREQAGSHMNAYVKTAREQGLVRWEPRKGRATLVQRYYLCHGHFDNHLNF